jgi:MoxR-like ATPase
MNNSLNTIESNLNTISAEKYFIKQEKQNEVSNNEMDNLSNSLKELGFEGLDLENNSRSTPELTIEEKTVATARFRNMYSSWKIYKKTQNIKENLDVQLFNLQNISQKEKNPTKYAKQIAKLNNALDIIETKINSEINSNPELFYTYHLDKLKNYKKQTENGLIYTDYVKSQKSKIVEALKENQNIFIHGPFGSGKTDIAIASAKEYLQLLGVNEEATEKEPIVLSGYRDIESHEIFGQPKLKVDKKGKTYSEFDFGPVYQAVEKGVPLIIDEYNSIPHSTLISLNFILEQGKRPGSVVNVKEDNGRQIISKEGFCVIATGNLPDETGNNNIIGRQDIDAAGLSRFGKKIEHGFLPQSQEALLEDGVLNRTGNELFEILMSKVVDNKIYAKLNPEAIEDLYKFAAFSSLIQDVYSGKSDFTVNFQGQDIEAIELIKGFSISWREINTIMKSWSATGCTAKLGGIISGFINEIPNKVAKEALADILMVKYDFNLENGFYDVDGLVEYGPRDIINKVYGDGPERTQESLAPFLSSKEVKVEAETSEINQGSMEKLSEIEEFINEHKSTLKEFEEAFEILCGDKVGN